MGDLTLHPHLGDRRHCSKEGMEDKGGGNAPNFASEFGGIEATVGNR
jgi:hypothetical protein